MSSNLGYGVKANGMSACCTAVTSARAMDGCILCCGTINLCQSPATSEIVNRCQSRVETPTGSTCYRRGARHFPWPYSPRTSSPSRTILPTDVSPALFWRHGTYPRLRAFKSTRLQICMVRFFCFMFTLTNWEREDVHCQQKRTEKRPQGELSVGKCPTPAYTPQKCYVHFLPHEVLRGAVLIR